MVRAPCCEKMGLKKGPWTPEEDQILIAYIQNYGHGNWRALPKQAGLLRCGKSCRLRWTNYLRPDIKRGNFSREEEDAIIKLHEMLGNRWSAIAARLPGRTDNEIKNVWHTHLKKRLKQNQSQISETKLSKCESNVTNESESMNCLPQLRNENPNYAPVSPQQSSSDFSSGTESSSIVTVENHDTVIRNNYNNNNSSDNLLDIDNLLSEALWVEDYNIPGEFSSAMADPQVQSSFPSYGSNVDDGMDFWYDLFMKAGEVPELPIV